MVRLNYEHVATGRILPCHATSRPECDSSKSEPEQTKNNHNSSDFKSKASTYVLYLFEIQHSSTAKNMLQVLLLNIPWDWYFLKKW